MSPASFATRSDHVTGQANDKGKSVWISGKALLFLIKENTYSWHTTFPFFFLPSNMDMTSGRAATFLQQENCVKAEKQHAKETDLKDRTAPFPVCINSKDC